MLFWREAPLLQEISVENIIRCGDARDVAKTRVTSSATCLVDRCIVHDSSYSPPKYPIATKPITTKTTYPVDQRMTAR